MWDRCLVGYLDDLRIILALTQDFVLERMKVRKDLKVSDGI